MFYLLYVIRKQQRHRLIVPETIALTTARNRKNAGPQSRGQKDITDSQYTERILAFASRVALKSKTGRVSCVCDWLRDTTGLDFGDRSWICNAATVEETLWLHQPRKIEHVKTTQAI